MNKLETIQKELLEAERNRNWRKASELSKEWTAEVKAENERLDQHLKRLNARIEQVGKRLAQHNHPAHKVNLPWKFF